MKFAFNLIILFLVCTLTSCTWVAGTVFPKSKEKPHLQARSIPPLKIPPGLSSDKFHANYPVSDRQYPQGAADVSVTPPGF